MGEILGNAALNTLMGMGVVFIVLILISLVISAFSLINKAEAKMHKQEAPVKAPAPAAPAPAAVEEDVTDDTELVAVIAAAIAAYEGTSVE